MHYCPGDFDIDLMRNCGVYNLDEPILVLPFAGRERDVTPTKRDNNEVLHYQTGRNLCAIVPDCLNGMNAHIKS